MTDSYWLGSTNWGSTRLRLQYELTQTNFDRHLLDPSIPIDDDREMMVADVATGTGVWALELAEKYPNVKVEGLDINLSEVPPRSWLPENVSFRQFDLLNEVPEELTGRYDIVHLQFVMVFVRDHNVDAVMERLVKMLKPRGYIQWTDSNRNAWSWRTAIPDQQPVEVLKLCDLATRLFGKHDPKWRWLDEHKELFERHGLQEVKFLRPPPKVSTEQPVLMNWLWAMEEGLGFLLGSYALKGEWTAQRARAEREAGELGVGMDYKMGRCIGRKAKE